MLNLPSKDNKSSININGCGVCALITTQCLIRSLKKLCALTKFNMEVEPINKHILCLNR